MTVLLNCVLVSGSFDDLRSRHMRFLQEAARLGSVHVLLWSDRLVREIRGTEPHFSAAERQYFVTAIRYVDRVTLVDRLPGTDALPLEHVHEGDAWAVEAAAVTAGRAAYCRDHGLELAVIADDALAGFPEPVISEASSAPVPRKRVVVTGCYDWFHTGHVRFFEEVAALGDLHAVVGHDANIRLLKGEGHPLHPEAERCYMVGSIRFVKRAYVSSGDGWLDAEPEIEYIKPDIYAVNEDGDRPEKRDFCLARGIEYKVLVRRPKPGLPPRTSTNLRGF